MPRDLNDESEQLEKSVQSLLNVVERYAGRDNLDNPESRREYQASAAHREGVAILALVRGETDDG